VAPLKIFLGSCIFRGVNIYIYIYIYIFKLYHKAVTEDGGGWEWEYWHRCLLDHRVEDLLLLPAVIQVPRLVPPAYKRWVPINFLLWNCSIVSCNGNSREDCKVHVKLIYLGHVKTMDLKCSEVIRCRSNQSFAPCGSSKEYLVHINQLSTPLQHVQIHSRHLLLLEPSVSVFPPTATSLQDYASVARRANCMTFIIYSYHAVFDLSNCVLLLTKQEIDFHRKSTTRLRRTCVFISCKRKILFMLISRAGNEKFLIWIWS
jgi:hypothetical protein